MAFQKQYGGPEALTRPVCAHLRSKAMLVSGSRTGSCPYGEDEETHCWCNLTQHVIGPDDGQVGRMECGTSRSCYRAAL